MTGSYGPCSICRSPVLSCSWPAKSGNCIMRGLRDYSCLRKPTPTVGEEQVTNKRQMYYLLTLGAFGNTIPQYSSVEEWRDSGDDRRYPSWGVRTKTPGGPCRLLCPAEEVEATVCSFTPHLPNISVMISTIGRVSWLGDVTYGPGGWVLSGIEYPERYHDWRPLMRSPNRWEGLVARTLLRRHLNSNSLADLEALVDRFPDHVYELSCLDRCFGTVPGRNAILWEVRKY